MPLMSSLMRSNYSSGASAYSISCNAESTTTEHKSLKETATSVTTTTQKLITHKSQLGEQTKRRNKEKKRQTIKSIMIGQERSEDKREKERARKRV